MRAETLKGHRDIEAEANRELESPQHRNYLRRQADAADLSDLCGDLVEAEEDLDLDLSQISHDLLFFLDLLLDLLSLGL